MSYEAGRCCDECGQSSPHATTCGECEVRMRTEAACLAEASASAKVIEGLREEVARLRAATGARVTTSPAAAAGLTPKSTPSVGDVVPVGTLPVGAEVRFSHHVAGMTWTVGEHVVRVRQGHERSASVGVEDMCTVVFMPGVPQAALGLAYSEENWSAASDAQKVEMLRRALEIAHALMISGDRVQEGFKEIASHLEGVISRSLELAGQGEQLPGDEDADGALIDIQWGPRDREVSCGERSCDHATVVPQLSSDGSCWQSDRCVACGATWWHDPPLAVFKERP